MQSTAVMPISRSSGQLRISQNNRIYTAFKVPKRLDLKDTRTSFNYLQRFAKDVIRREAKIAVL